MLTAKFKPSSYTLYTILLLYAFITLIAVLRHELFVDEVSVFMNIHNLSFLGCIKQIIMEGHPFFFYALAYPFIKIGFSMAVIQAICYISSLIAAFIILKFSPLPYLFNIAIISSAPMLFCYPVMARSYSLIPMLIAAMAAIHQKIKDNKKHEFSYALLIFTLANTHVIMFGFSLAAFLLFIYEKYINLEFSGRSKISISIMAFGLLLAAGQAISSLYFNPFFSPLKEHSIIDYLVILKNITVSMYAIMLSNLTGNNLANIAVICFMAALLAYLFGAILLYLKKISLRYAFAAAFAILFQIFIYLTSYSLIIPNRIFCMHFILFFFVWLANNKANSENFIFVKKLNIYLAILFAISIPAGINAIKTDFFENFSAAKEMANWIKKHIPDNENNIIYATSPSTALSAAYYLNSSRLRNCQGEIIKAYSFDFHCNMPKIYTKNKNIFVLVNPEDSPELENMPVIYRAKNSILGLESCRLVKLQ